MQKITLTAEQEQFLQEQINSGKYATAQEVITEAFKLLAERDKVKPLLKIVGGEATQKLLSEKVKQFREEQEKKKNKPIDSQREKLNQELRELFDKTRSIPGIQDITDEEIEAEIEAYRRGE